MRLRARLPRRRLRRRSEARDGKVERVNDVEIEVTIALRAYVAGGRKDPQQDVKDMILDVLLADIAGNPISNWRNHFAIIDEDGIQIATREVVPF
jgi:hypothetical protein